MIRVQLLESDNVVQFGGEALIERWLAEPSGQLWVDIQTTELQHAEHTLSRFGYHPLAIQDALRKRHPPKLEMFEDYAFILYRGILNVEDVLTFDHQQIAFFIGDNLLVSLHTGNSMGVEHVLNDDKLGQWMLDPMNIALKIMHRSAGIYLDSILEFEGLLSELEDELQESGDDSMMAQLVAYRSKLVKLRRVFAYHAAITEELKSPEFYQQHGIEHHLHEITDLHDRFERLYSLTQMHYDICGDLLDGYLSISSHQLNATMRMLTVITAVFVPLSFLAGLYGMNFEYIPELQHHNGYFFLLGIMGIIATSLIFFFYKKRWL